MTEVQKDVKLEAMADWLRNYIEKGMAKDNLQGQLGDNRIVVMVEKAAVKSKVVVPVVKTKKPSRIPKETAEKIKMVKKELKGNLDMMNLVVLLIRVKEELHRIKIKSLEPTKLALVRAAINEVEAEIRERLPEVKA